MVSRIQRYSLHDGPGIRTTVFLKGCPLRCAWCHNPENRAPWPELTTVESRCVRCGACVSACPSGVRTLEPPHRAPDGPPCAVCGACAQACPTEAVEMVGRPMSTARLVAEIRRDTIFHDESGGGVTFSGGEPLLQPGFLLEALDACVGAGIHTAVDTCGFAPTEVVLAVAERAELILYDLKMIDDDRHRALTGVSSRPIIENLKALSQVHTNIWVRIPVIPGCNDDAAALDALARLAAATPGVVQVNLLPYHRAGVAKFARVHETCALPGIVPPDPGFMNEVRTRFAAFGLNALIGG